MNEFDAQPTLRGNLVSLRPMKAEDFAALFQVASDPLIWEQHPSWDRYQQPVFRAFFDQGLASGGAFIVESAQDGSVIGSTRFAGWDLGRSEVEIGWTFLARSCWGGRHNAEMKALMLEHAFAFVDSVIFDVGTGNIRSQKAVLKLGAAEVARFFNEGGRHTVRFRLTRAAYQKGIHA